MEKSTIMQVEKSAQLPGLEGSWPIVQNPAGSCLLVALLRGQHWADTFNIFINCLNNGTKHVLCQPTAHTELGEQLILEGRAAIQKDIQQDAEHRWQGLTEVQHRQMQSAAPGTTPSISRSWWPAG